VQSSLIVAVLVTAGLGAAAFALIYMLYRSMLFASDDFATGRLRQISTQLMLDTPAELDRSVLATDTRVRAIQIIDSAGRVVQAAPITATSPLTTVRPAPGDTGRDVPPTPDIMGDVRISATTVDTAGGRYVVVLAFDQKELESIIRLVAVLVGVAAPSIVAIAAAAAYALVGRSLGSVERIRTRVAAITSADLSGRVPVPEPRDEVAALARTMNDMLARIQAGQDAQRRFVSDASHELRSPLTTITTALELGHESPEMLDAAVIEKALLPEAVRMRKLIDDLLLLAHADEHSLPRQWVDIDLDDTLGAQVRRKQRETSIIINVAVQPLRVQGDPHQIARAIGNLLDNAARYAQSSIEVRLTRDGQSAHIEIADDGPGIPAAERTRVFDRFYRVQHDRDRRTGGTGLGLAIVAEIIHAHRGDVRFEQHSTGGAVAVIDLPLTLDMSAVIPPRVIPSDSQSAIADSAAPAPAAERGR
jgi:signal transduction histidine kinase